MKYEISWHFGELFSVADFDTANEANEFWKLLKQIPVVKDIKTDRKHNVVCVVFSGGVKQYTYLTDKEVKAGSRVIVKGWNGEEIVKVVTSKEMTETQLSKVLPLDKYSHIVGVVEPA